jgi:hypothetical protein
VSSIGVGKMGIIDVLDASFEARQLRDAERRQVFICSVHPAYQFLILLFLSFSDLVKSLV